MMSIRATVLTVDSCQLLVLDHCTSQEVLVHSHMACRFCPGDQVCIHYSGAMTRSLPPQITAFCIRHLPVCGC